MQLTFTAPLWVWSGKAAWFFITVPEGEATMIRLAVPKKAGFGSVKVMATIGGTRWSTSVFPDAKAGTYLLPVKAAVRKAEGMEIGKDAEVTLTLDV